MSLPIPNECFFVAAEGGTVDFVVSRAYQGFYKPSECVAPPIVDGVEYYWRAEVVNAQGVIIQQELSFGAYVALAQKALRTTIIQSSNANQKVNFSSAPRVRLVAPSQVLGSGSLVVDETPIEGGTVGRMLVHGLGDVLTELPISPPSSGLVIDETPIEGGVVGKMLSHGAGDILVEVDPGPPILTTFLDYYVAKTGSDANDGLSVGSPFLTIQHAINVATTMLLIAPTCPAILFNIKDGVYDEAPLVGAGLGSPPTNSYGFVFKGESKDGTVVRPSAVGAGVYSVLTFVGPVVGSFNDIDLDGSVADVSAVSYLQGASGTIAASDYGSGVRLGCGPDKGYADIALGCNVTVESPTEVYGDASDGFNVSSSTFQHRADIVFVGNPTIDRLFGGYLSGILFDGNLSGAANISYHALVQHFCSIDSPTLDAEMMRADHTSFINGAPGNHVIPGPVVVGDLARRTSKVFEDQSTSETALYMRDEIGNLFKASNRRTVEVTTGAIPVTLSLTEDFRLVLVTSGGTQGIEELVINGFDNVATADYSQEYNGRTVVVKMVNQTDPLDVVHVLPHDYAGASYASSELGGYWEFFTLDSLGSAVTLVWMEYWWTVPLYGAYDQSNPGLNTTGLLRFRSYGSGVTVDLNNTSLDFLNKSVFVNESAGGALSTYLLPTGDHFTAIGVSAGVNFSFYTVDIGGIEIAFSPGDNNSQIRFAGQITPTGGAGKIKTSDQGAKIELALVGLFGSGPGTCKWAVLSAVGNWTIE